MQCEKKLDLLVKFGHLVAKENNLETLLWKMADFAKEVIDADRCSIFIYDKKRDILWTKAAHKVDRIEIPANRGIAGYAALSKEIQVVVDAYQDFRFLPDVDKKTGYVTKTVLAVPLLDHNCETIGVFQALNKKNGIFTFRDAEFLLFISNYTAAAIENAQLAEHLKRNQRKIINKLATAAEFKDEETSNHTKRVGEFSAKIAQMAGLDQEAIERIRYTAPMHDVGKIGIADQILLKPGRLSKEEFAIMKTHATIGYNILYDEENTILQEAAMIALEHHEKFDGTGYPAGKRGEEISLQGRIVAIADVFDALTSKRPYKEAWETEDALALLHKERSKHFDPDLVDLFLSAKDEIVTIKRTFAD